MNILQNLCGRWNSFRLWILNGTPAWLGRILDRILHQLTSNDIFISDSDSLESCKSAANFPLVVFKHNTLESNIDIQQAKQEQLTSSSKTMTKDL